MASHERLVGVEHQVSIQMVRVPLLGRLKVDFLLELGVTVPALHELLGNCALCKLQMEVLLALLVCILLGANIRAIPYLMWRDEELAESNCRVEIGLYRFLLLVLRRVPRLLAVDEGFGLVKVLFGLGVWRAILDHEALVLLQALVRLSLVYVFVEGGPQLRHSPTVAVDEDGLILRALLVVQTADLGQLLLQMLVVLVSIGDLLRLDLCACEQWHLPLFFILHQNERVRPRLVHGWRHLGRAIRHDGVEHALINLVDGDIRHLELLRGCWRLVCGGHLLNDLVDLRQILA